MQRVVVAVVLGIASIIGFGEIWLGVAVAMFFVAKPVTAFAAYMLDRYRCRYCGATTMCHGNPDATNHGSCPKSSNGRHSWVKT